MEPMMPAQSGISSSDATETRRYPRFIHEEDTCNWCGALAKLIKVELNENQKHIEMTYQCQSKRCDHYFYWKTFNVYKIIQAGDNAVLQFKEYEKKAKGLSSLLDVNKIQGEA